MNCTERLGVAMALAFLATFAGACGGNGGDTDAGTDADGADESGGEELDVPRDDSDARRDDVGDADVVEEDAGDGAGDGDTFCLCASDPDCDDGLVCNGEEQCVDCLCRPGLPLDDGAGCDDGDDCTADDACAAGVCVGGTPVCTCATDDDCLAHDDGDLCNGRPVCVGSACVFDPSTVVVCDPSADTDCRVNTCLPSTGVCAMEDVADGTTCDDGNTCTASDACAAGVCVGGPSTCECSVDDDCAIYEDGNACNGTTHCDAARCVVDPSTIVTCDPSGDTACRAAACDPDTGTCALGPRGDGTTCDDGDACTLGDACTAGSCAGADRSCADGNACTDDGCDAATGCVNAPNTAICDDGSACTTDDRCGGGACGGAAISCADGNACTDDTCDAATGCGHTPNTAACDDGNPCTSGEACAGGACGGGTPTACSDGSACTTDSCDPAAGGCIFTAISCDDSSVCTADSCDAVTGCGHAAVDCSDGNGCTDDSCDAVLGCRHANNTAACDDGDPCTTPDTCGGGRCVGAPTGLTNCGGTCVDLRTDRNNCGGCGTRCLFDEDCVARVCTVRAWDSVGAAVNPLTGALAHALGTDGTSAYVAWVADETPQDNVYVHRYEAAGGWTAVGAVLTSGGQVQPVVDIQFNVAVPNVLFLERGMTANSVHVKTYDGALWTEVGAPGEVPPCMMWFNGALALQGATPHHSSLGAGGCGIGIGYTYWTGAAWWQTPNPPAPMPGLITMNGGGSTDVVWDGSRALVALMDNGSRYVRYWVAGTPGAWTNLGASLNMRPAGAVGFGGDYLWMALDAATSQPWVAFSETDGATRGIFVKRYDPAGAAGWTLVGATRISDAANNADFPSLAFVGGIAYVAYVEQVGGVGLVRVRRWSGTAWERVGTSLNVAAGATAALPYLVGVGTVPYVAFREPVPGTARIYVKRFP